MTYVLGLNAFHADAAACLIKDGELVAAVEEGWGSVAQHKDAILQALCRIRHHRAQLVAFERAAVLAVPCVCEDRRLAVLKANHQGTNQQGEQ